MCYRFSNGRRDAHAFGQLQAAYGDRAERSISSAGQFEGAIVKCPGQRRGTTSIEKLQQALLFRGELAYLEGGQLSDELAAEMRATVVTRQGRQAQ